MIRKQRHNPKAHAPALYIPCWLSQVSTSLISNHAKMLYGRLAQWCDETGEVYRSAPQLAEELGTSVRNIERYLKELRDLELIGTFHPQAGGVNHFEFYDHEWMSAPIKEQLTYKNDKFNPPTEMTEPPDRNDGTPPTKVADINRSKIKRNKILKHIPDFNKSTIMSYTEFDEPKEEKEKSDYLSTQQLTTNIPVQLVEKANNYTKSDYCEYKTNNKADSKYKDHTTAEIIQKTTHAKQNKLKDFQKDARFMKFYNAHPKKVDPWDAYKTFLSIVKNDDELLEIILKDIELRKAKHSGWENKQYIKSPARYLRNGEWLGEIINVHEETIAKKQQELDKANERLALQEKASQERAEKERQFQIQKQTDAVAYRRTIKQAPSMATIAGLREIRNVLGA
jgi:hypothetical protein